MTFRRVTVLLAMLALGLASCGSDDDEAGGGGGSASSEATALAVKITESGGASTVEVPSSVEAGLVEVSFENSGEAPHSVQLIRVDGDQTADQVKEVTGGEGGIPDWLHGAGGLGTTPPGQSGTATVVLEPGTYYAQDDEGEKGGITKFEVTGEAGEAELPSTDATITAVDYAFETSGLKAGRNTVTFENTGEELHHAIAAPINEGSSLADVEEFFMSEGQPSGPPPVNFEGGFGTAVLDGGAKEVTDLELEAGRYAFVCFIPDRAGGPPHVAKGMLQEIEIPG